MMAKKTTVAPARKLKAVMPKAATSSASKPSAFKRPLNPKSKPKPKSQSKLKPKIKLKPWTHDEVVEVFTRFRSANPDPKGELEHLNPYTLLVAVVLSAQATDAGVNKATRNLFPLADTPEKMAALGEDRVRDLVKTIGLYRNKAKNVIGLSEQLIANHASTVPRSREALEALPGVGRKTANVVLNMAFGEPTIAVDTHLFRVGNRTNLAPGVTPLEVELGFEKIIPDQFKRHAHHWLILHGRYTCIARKPLCERCIINDLCRWPEKTVTI